MLLNTIKELRGITEVCPHTLKESPFPQGTISETLLDKLVTLTLDICKEIEALSKIEYTNNEVSDEMNKFIEIKNELKTNKEISRNNKSEYINFMIKHFAEYIERFDEARAELKKESGNKTVAEYVEIIYIIAYQFYKYLGVEQKAISEIFNIDKKFKERLGISPVADCKAYNTRYEYKLPIDEDQDIIEEIVPYIGQISAMVSNTYFIGITNNMGISANITNTNTSGNDKKADFYARQFLLVARTNEDYYDGFFYNYIITEGKTIKEIVYTLIDTKDKKLNDDILEFMINEGIEIAPKNLNNNDYDEFTLNYDRYKDLVNQRKYFEEAKYDPDSDFDDMFTVDEREHFAGRDIDKIKVCESELEIIEGKLTALGNELIEAIDLSTFTSENNIGVLKFILKEYEAQLQNNDKDITRLCAKHFITKYFKLNGVSETSVRSLREFLETKGLYNYADRYENDYVSLLTEAGFDIGSEKNLTDSLNEMRDKIKESLDKKDNRGIHKTILMYIDADTFNIDDAALKDYRDIYDGIYFVISSSNKLQLSNMAEKEHKTYLNRKFYTYTNYKEEIE